MTPYFQRLLPARYLILILCIALPWLNPFTSPPSTAVIPLLLSWALAAVALCTVVELPIACGPYGKESLRQRAGAFMLLAWLLGALLWVPPVVDRALTLGLLASLLCMALMVALGRRAALDDKVLRCLMMALLAAAVLSSVLAVCQYLGQAREWAPWVNQPVKGDAYANLRQRNQFASLTALGLVVLLGAVALRVQAAPMSRAAWVLVWGLINLMAAGVASSLSRTGAVNWLFVSVWMTVWVWRTKPHPQRWALLGLAMSGPVLVGLWSCLLPWLSWLSTGEWGANMILRMTGQTHISAACSSRSVLWANAMTLIAQHPWLGWGWGETDYAHFITPYSDLRFCELLDNAHNLPLHLAVELGVPMACALLVYLVAWVLRRAPWRETQLWRVVAWGLLLVIGIHSLLEYPLWYGPFQMTVGLAIGLLWAPLCAGSDAASGSQTRTTQTRTVQTQAMQMPSPIQTTQDMQPAQSGQTTHSPQRPQAVLLGMAAVMLIGCLYTAWDFHRVSQIYRAAAARDAAYRDDPLHHAKQSWLFKNQADFAELTTQTVRADNAAALYPLALRLMHYSPEERVVQRAIDSAQWLGIDAPAQELAQRLDDVKRSMPR